MVCPNCGTDSPPSATVCDTCGTPLGGSAVLASDAVTMASTPGTATSTRAVRAVTAGPLTPGAPLGPRYRILRELGAGGMGVVYQAWDAELAVAVALKVIRPELNDNPQAAEEIERRFKRELLLARQVTHKHVVRIHDLGEIDGVKYITMPFIEGQDLAHVLRDQGQLPIPEALRLAKQIAAGLLAAHEAGVVHRDLKPENVMIDQDGHAVIMDFGISRSVGPGATATATVAGAVVGTLEYMAPEQARGVAVDHRADIYAFGLMLHDMLVGRRRLTSASALTEMMGRMQTPPASVRTVAPQIPEDLERIVSRCLKPDPEQRYASTDALVADLEALGPDGYATRVEATGVKRWRLATAALLVVLVALAGVSVWMIRGRAGAGPPAPHEPVSVLIADFDNKAGDPVFEGSLEQALNIGIEGASFISSFPRRDALRTAAQIRSGATLDEEIARLVSQREGIKVVLAGVIEQKGSEYVVTVRALEPLPGGQELATARASASTKPAVLGAVASVAEQLRRALGDTAVQTGAGQNETFTAASLEAARDYSKAQELANANRDEEAITLYQRAIAQDPNFGRAYSGWAVSAGKLGRKDEAKRLYEEKAFKLLDRMTEREKYRTLGVYYMQFAGDYQQGIENYQKLIQRYPADGVAHNNLAVGYVNTLNFPKALEEGRRVLEIYPRSVLYRYNYALYAMYAGDFETSAKEAQSALELNPNTPKAYLAIAMAALAAGHADEARAAYEKAAATGPRGASIMSAGVADLLLYQGKPADTIALLERGITEDETNKNEAGAAAKLTALAEAQQMLGNLPAAIDATEKALSMSRTSSTAVAAASVFVSARRTADILALAAEIGKSVQSQNRAYGKLLEARVSIAANRPADAIDALRAAQKLADLWLVHYYLGVAYVEAGQFPQALDQMDECRKRRGEATAVFLDDWPTYRYMVPVLYWTGRAQQGMGRSPDGYKAFLALRPEPSRDPLAIDARKRVASH